MKRRWLAALLAATLAFGSSVPALAAETDGGALRNEAGEDENPVETAENEEIVAAETFSEIDANGLTWNLEGGVLTISGNGVIENNPAFMNLKEKVTSIVIEEGITGIGKSAFEQYYCLEQISIPESVREIGEDAFFYADRLRSVSLPNGLTEIKGGTFAYCRYLEEISIPNDVTKIGEGAFLNCGALASISLPENVTEIDAYAFSGSGLTSISIPENTIAIGIGAFEHCTSLTKVSIPKGITEIQCNTFAYCHKLGRVTIPNHVTKIADMAFSDCAQLLEITIPNSVKSIGYAAFLRCQSLQTITFKGDAPKIIKEDEYSYDEAPFEGALGATAYYPAGNPTYTEEVKAAYGSGLTWVAKEIPKMSFTDVNDIDWYYDAADFVFSRGIMTGMTDTEFGPGVKLSRAQFATILYRMEGEPEVAYDPAAFPDVREGQFYTAPAMWAKSTGVISGYEDGRFGPADEITREQMAVMMYRYATMLGLDTSAEGDMSGFPDAGQVSPFADREVKWAVGEGLIKGDGGNVNPQGTAERAQCATIIMRFMEGYGL